MVELEAVENPQSKKEIIIMLNNGKKLYAVISSRKSLTNYIV